MGTLFDPVVTEIDRREMEADRDREIDGLRAQARGRLDSLTDDLARLRRDITTLCSDGVYDIEIAEGRSRHVIDHALITIEVQIAAIRASIPRED